MTVTSDPDVRPVEPMTDEAIENFVKFVESICVLAESLGLSVPQAARMMLKTSQVLSRMQQGKGVSALASMLTGKIQ